MRSICLSFVATCIVTLSSFAESAQAASFTGKIEMKMSTDKGLANTMTAFVGEEGMVSEMAMPTGAPGAAAGAKMKTLIRFDKPDTVFMIDDARRSYTEMVVPQQASTPPSTPTGSDETWTVKKLGSEKILGYPATHVLATSSKGTSLELWTTQALFDKGAQTRAFGQSAQVPGSLMSALDKEGAAGFMMRMTSKSKDGRATTMEVVKIEKTALPKSMFAVPAGYTKSAMPGMPGMPPDAQKKLDEAMKNMTPEQRAAMQKAMGGAK